MVAGTGEDAGDASVRRYQGLSPSQTESVSVRSKRKLPLAKAEPFSNASDSSVRMYLRKGKNNNNKT